MIPDAVRSWLSERGVGEVVSERPAAGGCINNGSHIATSRGERFFLKTNPSAPEDMFEREAEGLEALLVPGGPRVPRVYLSGPGFILLEDLAPAARSPHYWSDFGRQMAALHQKTHPRFGFEHDNYIGSTPQPNGWMDNGWEFFGERRLIFQAEYAARKHYLSAAEVSQVEKLVSHLPDLVPDQPASILHGDLWSGNALTDEHGAPAIIDPAAYYGWAEADLAMTSLFGAFPNEFYASYQEVRPLEPGFHDRFQLYNLYHLLNHLNLFGTGYYPQVIGVIKRFV